MTDLVIARYCEDLDWIADVPPPFRITVYNKGPAIRSPIVWARAEQIIDRVNEGRESETFLHHMSIACDDPKDITAFTQGNPFEHSPDFIALLGQSALWKPVQPLSCRWKAHLPPSEVMTHWNDDVAGLHVRRELFSLANWAPLHFMDAGALRTALNYWAECGTPEGLNMASHFFALCGLADLAERAAAHLFGQFAYGAIFAARNDHILALPRESLFMMRHLTTGPALFGYVMERLWLHLLGMDFLMPARSGPAAFEALRESVRHCEQVGT